MKLIISKFYFIAMIALAIIGSNPIANASEDKFSSIDSMADSTLLFPVAISTFMSADVGTDQTTLAFKGYTVQQDLAMDLKNGEMINVRKLLGGLKAGDLVKSITLQAKALENSSYVDLIVDDQVFALAAQSEQSVPMTFQLNKINGVDYQRLYIRIRGHVFADHLRAAVISNSPPPSQPNPPNYPPTPPPQGGLKLQGLQVGLDVMTRDGYRGTIQGFFGNGSIAVRTSSGAMLNKNYSDLTQKGCYNHVCSEQGAIADAYIGRVIGFFPNGDIGFQSTSGSLMNFPPSLVAGRGCLAEFCSDNKALTRDLYMTTIFGYTIDHQKIAVRSTSGFIMLKSAYELSSNRCFQQFCTGQQILTIDGYRGVIIGFFRNNDVAIRTTSGAYLIYPWKNIAG